MKRIKRVIVAKSKMYKFCVKEQDGSINVENITMVEMSNSEAFKLYTNSRYAQSVKGFKRPFPISIEIIL